jgi:hypothetical protein
VRTIEIDLTENDLDDILSRVVYRDETVEWSFQDQYGEEIKVRFIKYDEEQGE